MRDTIAVTPATKLLDKLALRYELHTYDHDPAHTSYGDEAAEALGVESERVLKTLLATVDGRRLIVAVLRVDAKLDLKSAARASAGKKAAMAEPADAERSSGYIVGGISPIGQKKRLATFIDADAKRFDTVFVSGGRRGLEIELSPADLAAATNASFAPLAISLNH